MNNSMKPIFISFTFIFLSTASSLGQKTSALDQQTATVRGVITYYFNQYQGNKPDLGAEIFVVDSAKTPEFSQALADSFYYGNAYRGYAERYREMRKEVPSDIKDNIEKWGVKEDDSFGELDKRNAKNTLLVKYAKDVIKTTVDGTGTFSVQLAVPGTYYIIIRSKGRTGLSITEVTGKVYTKKISPKAGEYLDVSNNFDL